MNKGQSALIEHVESWLNGNLESVAQWLLTLESKAPIVDFVAVLLKERGNELNFDGSLDLARLSEMLR